jgi:hypothetical protein
LEQLEVARAERMRQNGHGALTLEDARTWIEETGLCLFLPKRQFSTSLAPSFVEAVSGQRNITPDSRQIAAAEELLVRLELDGVVVRLNLLGQPGEQPDYVVAAWVLPYVYALRGDRDWRRSPQLTGSRQVSPLAIQAYKQLESADMTIAELKQNLGHGVTETAVLRAITELWQQLRIIPVVAAPGKAARWQLLRHRFQKAIAEGASTSQVTAISVLASIFLQAVIAASMEEVEIFLSPLTARSKIREVIRGLVATRQVHTLSFGHAPHFYVAGTLPEFAPAVTTYTSSIGSSYIPYPHDEEPVAEPAPIQLAAQREELTPPPPEAHEHRPHANSPHRPAPKPSAPRPHFNRPARDRKPAASESGNRRAAKNRAASRSSSSRPAGARWASNGSKTAHANGSSRTVNGNHAAKNGTNGHARPAGSARPANGSRPAATRSAKPAARSASLNRTAASARKTSARKPALAASNGSKRFGYSSKQGSKKRG